MLQLDNIHLTLGKGTPLVRPVLQGLSLQVPAGEFVTIVGGNGAGKSTLFNVISGFLSVDQGEIYLGGRLMNAVPLYGRARWIAKVMQDPKLGTMEALSIEENLALAYKRGQSRGLLPFVTARRRVFFQEKLALLGMGLENRLKEPVAHLSGGQRQALSLIMALVAESQVLLLDEITAALDPKIAQVVVDLASHLVRAEDRTCLMITHNMAHALHYGHRTVVLREGVVAQSFSGDQRARLTPLSLAAELE